MGSVLYRNYLKLLERWPLDPLKKGRDLGEYIRGGVLASFRGGSDEPRDSQTCQDIYSSLNNITNNRYKDAFYVTTASSASGLSQQECTEISSNEFQATLEEQEKTWREKIKTKISK